MVLLIVAGRTSHQRGSAATDFNLGRVQAGLGMLAAGALTLGVVALEHGSPLLIRLIGGAGALGLLVLAVIILARPGPS